MSWTSPITALSHLSDEAVAAFADGVLSDTARQRAQSHMAGCAECSDAVYGQRAARAALRAALSPRLPAGLFERLRELPITAELPLVQFPAALSADGQPLFAAADTVEPNWSEASPVVLSMEPFPTSVPSDRQTLLAAEAAHRRASARFGLGATVVALFAAGVLATTAANAGGVLPRSNAVQPGASGHDTGAVTAGTSSRLGQPVHAPVQMTLLSVPSSGR
jgi:anti-sigma factor RsiW